MYPMMSKTKIRAALRPPNKQYAMYVVYAHVLKSLTLRLKKVLFRVIVIQYIHIFINKFKFFRNRISICPELVVSLTNKGMRPTSLYGSTQTQYACHASKSSSPLGMETLTPWYY